jgi:cysteinyl-tRNA synthetase
MNITDVGHLTGENEGDADHGEDKLEKGARREGISARDVALKYEKVFTDNTQTLRFENPTVLCRATDYIPEQIAMVKILIDKWYTYIIPWDGIYMDTSKIDDYGVLVGKKHIEGLQSGKRVTDDGKKNPTDFALWKLSPENETRQMEWIFDGPKSGELLNDELRNNLTDEEQATRWFPGWHIECSAMSTKFLWDHFDIHTWGIDHIPVHHTNEIAQSECAGCHKPWVNFWVHTQFLNINNDRVAKSTGNVVFLQEVLDKWYAPEDLRYFYLQAHYRSFQDFTRESLEAASKGRKSIIKKIAWQVTLEELDGMDSYKPREMHTKLSELILEDLDSVKTLTQIHLATDGSCGDLIDILLFDKHITKLWLEEGVRELLRSKSVSIPSDIQELADQRRQAKQDKNRALSDELRDKLKQWGWNMLDGKDNYELAPL